MARKRTPRKRIGHKEAAALNSLRKHVKAYKIFRQNRTQGETRFNDRLIDHLRQMDDQVENTNIHPASFVGEIFRPECFLRGKGKYPLCAIECKKLTDKFAKARWKEGLSQSLMYMHHYKSVIYVLYDFTSQGSYAKAFGRGNRSESGFAKLIRDSLGVHIVALKPT